MEQQSLIMQEVKTIIISRTDSIGDVVLTLPAAHVLKEKFPGCKTIFLGKSYTKPVVECCSSIDEIVCWDEIAQLDKHKQIEFFLSLQADCIIHVFPNKQIAVSAKKAGIPVRIGTSHRLFHWFTCNKLPNFTRKNSKLHEAQLNLKLLQPLGIDKEFSLNEIDRCFDLTKVKPLGSELKALIDPNRMNIILHPKSRGSTVEWGLQNFSALGKILPKDKFKIFITGTKQEGELIGNIFSEDQNITNMTGRLTLDELISFVNNCDAMVAASTGPLHLASVLGKKAVGMYSPVRPIHPGRWAPLGKDVSVLVSKKSCANCGKGRNCDCLTSVTPQEVAAVLMKELK
ncbi:MAG: lipopolysaccharide heptosyltransferase family protein [Bacteroidetes bacterium]|nr:MAG: lipopolysaccharide heptosyltransferase family protein [Bacteroidota bacterium]